jgi:hypothetical protein
MKVMHNDEQHNLHSSPNIVKAIKSRRISFAGHVARKEEGKVVYRILVGRPEGKKTLGRSRRRWEDNIKSDLRERGIDGRTGFGWLRMGSNGGFL